MPNRDNELLSRHLKEVCAVLNRMCFYMETVDLNKLYSDLDTALHLVERLLAKDKKETKTVIDFGAL